MNESDQPDPAPHLPSSWRILRVMPAQGGICGVCDQPRTLPIYDRDLRAHACAPCAEHLVAAQRALNGHVITHHRSITPST